MTHETRDWGLFKLHLGDCVASMRTMADASVDAVVTDPPYGIRFMGEAWDGADIEKRAADRRAFNNNAPGAGPNGGHNSLAAEAGKYSLSRGAMLAFQIFTQEWAVEALRILKPGGHLLSFSSPRTYHRMTCGLEDAGFEIRDQIGWVFGSGFPKAQLWSQAKAAAGDADAARMIAAGFEGWARGGLKPAWEPICVARKPMTLNTSENVLEFGTGALNIDACRVPTGDNLNGGAYSAEGGRTVSQSMDARTGSMNAAGATVGREFVQPLGRFPANLIHDGSDEVLDAFPNAPGQMADASTSSSSRKTQNVYGAMTRGNGREGEASANAANGGVVGFQMRPGQRRADSNGSAARFFYCAKASKADRGPENNHPTVKPTELMRYLCRLITPAGGLVLDPFAGSGSTGKAAMLEGFRFVGCEKELKHLIVAERRIATAAFGPAAFGAAA